MTPEGEVVHAVLDFLSACGIFAWRNNTTGIYDPKAKRYRQNHGLNGVADILGLLPDGRFLAIECKSDTGKQTAAQKEFEAGVRLNNGLYVLVRPSDWYVVLQNLLDERYPRADRTKAGV